jgi:Leucine-rich repeat (LRR) protein
MKTKAMTGFFVLCLLGGSLSFSAAAAQGAYQGSESSPPEMPEIGRHAGEAELISAAREFAAPPDLITQPKEPAGGFDCSTVVSSQYLESECEALVAFYESTNGANWTDNSGWLLNADLRAWHGLTFKQLTSGDKVVERIDLAYNQLSGSIPAALGSLTNLRILYLFDNQLSGGIPPELGSLTNLVHLYLDNNQLSGGIPAALGNLAKLKNLYLSSNQLSGNIPAELGNLTDLTELHLANNQLSGSIPAGLGSLTNLRNLYLNNNQLSGSIPAELGNMTNLLGLFLYNNQLSGNIPAELGNLTNLLGLYLFNNQLSGSIPAELGALIKLKYLDLSGNQLSGSIPAEIGSLTELRHLNLSHNHLRGNVPASITNLANLCVMGQPPGCSDYDTDFGYNLLNVPQPEPPQSFMYQKDPDWDLTQNNFIKIYLPAILK